MKRVLAGLLLAVLSLVAVVPADSATMVWAHKKVQPLKFRTTGLLSGLTDPTAVVNPQAGTTAGMVDSLYASGIAKFDTTAGVTTLGWIAPFGGTAVDSGFVCRLTIYDAGLSTVTLGKTSATAESIYVKTQVSANEVDWHDCAIIPGQAPVLNAFTVQTTVNAAVLTFVSSTNTGHSGKLWSIRFHGAQSGAGLKSGQDINHIHEFPFVRFIIMGSRSLNHSYKADITYMSASADGRE